jgi:hypothetical protein
MTVRKSRNPHNPLTSKENDGVTTKTENKRERTGKENKKYNNNQKIKPHAQI